MLNKAIEIAAIAHTGQKDLGENDYILHPIRVMMSVSSQPEKIVAVLHDVLKNTRINLSNLEYLFPVEILSSIELLTKVKSEKYSDYIKKLVMDDIARKVKIADLEDNMNNITRLFAMNQQNFKRLCKYQEARSYLITI